MSRPRPPQHLIEQQFGRLTVCSLRHVQRAPGRWHYMALCRCACGGLPKEILISSLKRGATKSCGCDKSKYLKITGALNSGFKGYKEIRMHFWRGYRTGAADRGHAFNLTMKYAWDLFERQGRQCALSGVPLVFGKGAGKTLVRTTASIDRIDVTKGYVEGNIQWVHKHVNLMRNVLPVDNFVEWCKKVARFAASVDRPNGVTLISKIG